MTADRRSRFVAGFAILAASPTLAAAPIGTIASEATIDGTRQIDFTSAINSEKYRIQIFIPRGPPPPSGYPTLYLLDGNALFGSFANAVRNRSMAGEIEAAVVVGISSGDGGKGADRTLDFTTKDLTAHEKVVIKDLGGNPPFGGSDKFFQVIQEEIKPQVARQAPIDPKRSILFGWSLGGLFTMHTMFAHPDAFMTYLALSPSLWRSGKVAFQEVPGFEHRVENGHAKPSLAIGVGSLEEEVGENPVPSMSAHEWAEEATYARMVGNAKDMAATLRPFFEERKLSFSFTVFENRTHNGVPWTALNPFLDFALSRR